MHRARQVYAILLIFLMSAAGVAALIWFGAYNVAADDRHTELTRSALDTIRERSIQTRARDIQVPNLDATERIASGAGEYAEMCAGCHLAPGIAESEIRQGLNPQPPDLTKHPIQDAAEAFWIVKHGIKMTWMPAWGNSHDDQTL